MSPTPAGRQPVVELSDPLLTGVMAAGLRLGVAGDREDVVRWADCQIGQRDDVPAWLIDLSMSHDKHNLDIIGILNRVAGDADCLAVCRGLYSLIPVLPVDYSYDQ